MDTLTVIVAKVVRDFVMAGEDKRAKALRVLAATHALACATTALIRIDPFLQREFYRVLGECLETLKPKRKSKGRKSKGRKR